jgi:hypothetical protein
MRNRLLRISIVLGAVAVGVAAAYFVWGIDRQMTGERDAEQSLGDRARAVTETIGDTRASQEAYVAQGQGADFWTARVSSQLAALDLRLRAFGASLTTEAARAAFESAGSAVENLHKLDAKAREYVQADQYLMASDLIFSDGLEAAGAAAAEIDLALAVETQARENALGDLRRRLALVLGATAGAMLLALVLLLPAGRRPEPSEASELHIAPRPGTDEVSEAGPQPAEEAAMPDLAGAARLCTDLGCVLETRELSRLLERAAHLLDASGMIVWIGDPAGSVLRPVIAHGYSDQTLARMGSIPRDAANATAAAYRSAELRSVSGDPSANGAVVAPLMTPGGCIGVLTTELRNGGETKEAVRALVTILAAQLSAVVAAPPAAQSGAARAQG